MNIVPSSAIRITYVILSFTISFIASLLTIPPLIKKSLKKNFTGIDLHKPEKPKIAKSGGIAVYIGFLAACTLSGLYGIDDRTMLGMILASTLGAVIGLIDDIFQLEKKTLILSTFLTGIPIITYRLGTTTITLTPIGPIDLGIIFWITIPFIFAYYTNSVNIYAGFNGLEAGLGLVTSISLGISALIYNSVESAILLFSLSGGLLALLKYNWYPAKIFPGNMGTYLIGAVYAASIIGGTIKTAGLIATLPYFINFILRLINGLNWTVGKTTTDGKVYTEKIEALWALFMRKPTSEKTVTIKCIIIQSIFAIITVFISYIHRNLFNNP